MLTIKQITKAIKNKYGYDVTIYKGKGYYYFSGSVADTFYEQAVYINSINQITLADWLDVFYSKIPT